MTTGQTTDEPNGAPRCKCGYLLRGLTEKRCPECGRPFPKHAIRRTPYLVWGFVGGFSPVALLTIGVLIIDLGNPGNAVSDARADMMLILDCAAAVVTGLIGMAFGYIVYRIMR